MLQAAGRFDQRPSPCQYQSLLLDLRRAGIPISKGSCQRNRATRSRGRRGAGSEAARDGWWHIEKPRRREQSVRSRARPVIPACVIPLFNVWRSVVARSRTQRSTALRSAVPVSFHCLLSQWKARYLSQAPVVLYPDPHAAPFTPIHAASSSVAASGSVAQRVVGRRCLRHIELLQPSALKLLQCTFTSLRAVLRRWWSRDLFGYHYDKRHDDIRPIDFRMCARYGKIHSHSLQNVNPHERVRIPAFCTHRYIRVRK